MRSRDTSPDARKVQQAVLRRMPTARRIEMAFQMSEDARKLSASGMRSRTPSLSKAEAERLVLRQILGRPLFDAAWKSKESR